MLPGYLKQPLLHFFLLGAGLFALFAVVDDSAPVPDRPQILVSDQDARWLATQFEGTWSRPPTEDELSHLIEEFVREEIYVREALALGLDQGDAIVRRRLRQKMEFLTEAGAEAVEVDDATLQAFYEENADTFRIAPQLSFTQILLPADQANAADLILAELAAGGDPDLLGQRTLLPSRIPLAAPQSIDNIFGNGFFERLSALELGTWSGPVSSGYGTHLVRLEAVEDAILPPLEAVRTQVELQWRAEKARALRTERFEILRDQYEILRPDPALVLTK
jgi:hypothetical protein